MIKPVECVTEYVEYMDRIVVCNAARRYEMAYKSAAIGSLACRREF